MTGTSDAAGTLNYLDNGARKTVLLDRGSTSIGRSEGEDVILGEQTVSRHHARIVRDGSSYAVVDENSTRGTFLNGERVQHAVLRNGDALQFGSLNGVKLRFHDQTGSPERIEAASLYQLLSVSQPLSRGVEKTSSAQQMGQLNWLLSAARQLNQGGAVLEIARVLLELTLQLTGVERGFVFLCEDEHLRFALGLNADGESLFDEASTSRRAIDQAIASEAKFSISNTMDDLMAREWPSVLANQIRSIYCIPLRSRAAGEKAAHLLGLVYLDSQTTATNLSSIDHELLDAIATESAALVHNALMAATEQEARRAQQELAVAARIHGSLMSSSLPALSYAALNATSVPCLAIGGDFYDAVVQADAVSLVIVDVSGKGVSSAIVAATLQGIIHAQLLAGQPLPEIATMVNRFLCARNIGKYATMVLLRLFPDGRVEYLNCGHIAPMIVGTDAFRTLTETNLVVGLIEAAGYESAWDQVRSGERLLLVTDGITEAENAEGHAFGDLAFHQLLPQTNLAGLLEALTKFQGSQPAQDDCTLVEVHFHGLGT